MKTQIFLQARMGSTRLPGKVLMEFNGKTMLSILVERLKKVENIDKIILVTSTDSKNSELIEEAKKLGVDYFQGNEENALDRFFQASQIFQPDTIIRVGGDCPLIDPELINEGLRIFENEGCDALSNARVRTYPDGMDFEIFKASAIKTSWEDNLADFKQNGKDFYSASIAPDDYILENKKFKNYDFASKNNLSNVRITLDYKDDFELIKKILEGFNDNNFGLNQIINFLNKNPELYNLNRKHINFEQGFGINNMANEIKIGNKIIGPGRDVFLSAETGVTANGSVETAKKLIDAAVFAGLDAIKFQIIGADQIHSDHSMTYTYKTWSGDEKTENLAGMLKQYEFSLEQWQDIKKYADEKGIIMFATTDYPGGVDIGEKINLPAYKICSWDLNYYPLIRRIARIGKPTIIDAGTADMEGLARIVNIFKEEKNDQLIFLHCHHAKDPKEINIKSLQCIRDSLGVLVGYSSSDRNFDIDFAAMAFEPVMIEKRLTLDKDQPTHHHAISLEPQEMQEYIKKIRMVQSAIGRYGVFPSRNDLDGVQKYWRRIVANCEIKKGEKFTGKNIECKRPKTGGLDPSYYEVILGHTSKKDLKENEPITWDAVFND